ncbi:MAG: hypothetical protein NXI04_29900 [Planctomycetaceae bacterium]|nr:hypothetical protein [Planctomycetaceae bacterium]
MKNVALMALLLCSPLYAQDRPKGEDATNSGSNHEAWKPKWRVKLFRVPSGTDNIGAADWELNAASRPRAVEKRLADGRVIKEIVYEPVPRNDRLPKVAQVELHCDVFTTATDSDGAVAFDSPNRTRVVIPGLPTIECESALLKGGTLLLVDAKTVGAPVGFGANELSVNLKAIGLTVLPYGLELQDSGRAYEPGPVPDELFRDRGVGTYEPSVPDRVRENRRPAPGFDELGRDLNEDRRPAGDFGKSRQDSRPSQPSPREPKDERWTPNDRKPDAVPQDARR